MKYLKVSPKDRKKCTRCNGHGRVQCPVRSVSAGETCALCQNTGYVDCPACREKGGSK